MRTTLQIACVQPLAHDRAGFPRAWKRVLENVRAAAAQADLVVLPEGTIPAYVLGDAVIDEGVTRAALADAAAVAREARCVLVLGAVRSVEGALHNSAIVYDADGSLAGYADKQFLWHFDHQWFAAGVAARPIATSLGVLGVLVCADGRIPTIAHTLVERGAQLLVMPTAWVTSGRDPSVLENVQADLLARIRARENRVPFVAANKCGVELGCVAYCGKSQIVNADGAIVSIAGADAPETIFGEVNLRDRSPHTAAREVEAQAGAAEAMRISISARRIARTECETKLHILESDVAIVPGGTHAAEHATKHFAAARCGDETLLHPAGLVAYRRSGGLLAIWETSHDTAWQSAFARARAVELRMYIVTIDESRGRAYAVDPDGTVLCGTFGDYGIASFRFDPQRANDTELVPGTDVLKGLAAAAASSPA